MENIHLENIDFEYESGHKIFSGANIDISRGEMVLVCGKTGCGKSTLLRLIRDKVGQKAGFVMQNPDNQIVCDKVLAELESGAANSVAGPDKTRFRIVRQRVAETAGYFGISHQLGRDTENLSGGEKQVLNIASVMAADPEVLILDEPTSMLDPIMADRVIDMVKNINKELGITVIIAEHRSDRLFAYADKVILIENRKTICKSAADMAQYMRDNREFEGFLPEVTRAVQSPAPLLSVSEAMTQMAAGICKPTENTYRAGEIKSEKTHILQFENITFLDYLPPKYKVYSDEMCCLYSCIGKVLDSSEYIDEIRSLSFNSEELQKHIDEVYEELNNLVSCKKEDIKLYIFVHFS